MRARVTAWAWWATWGTVVLLPCCCWVAACLPVAFVIWCADPMAASRWLHEATDRMIELAHRTCPSVAGR